MNFQRKKLLLVILVLFVGLFGFRQASAQTNISPSVAVSPSPSNTLLAPTFTCLGSTQGICPTLPGGISPTVAELLPDEPSPNDLTPTLFPTITPGILEPVQPQPGKHRRDHDRGLIGRLIRIIERLVGIGPNKPDLVVTDVAFKPTTTNTCGNIGLYVTVKNQGKGKVTESFKVKTQGNQLMIVNEVTEQIGAGASRTILAKEWDYAQIDPNTPPPFTFNTVVTVDDENKVNEGDEGNNQKTSVLILPTQPAGCATPSVTPSVTGTITPTITTTPTVTTAPTTTVSPTVSISPTIGTSPTVEPTTTVPVPSITPTPEPDGLLGQIMELLRQLFELIRQLFGIEPNPGMPTPTPTPSITVAPTTAVSPTLLPSPTASATATPTVTPTATPTTPPTNTPTPSPTTAPTATTAPTTATSPTVAPTTVPSVTNAPTPTPTPNDNALRNLLNLIIEFLNRLMELLRSLFGQN